MKGLERRGKTTVMFSKRRTFTLDLCLKSAESCNIRYHDLPERTGTDRNGPERAGTDSENSTADRFEPSFCLLAKISWQERPERA